MTRYFLDAETTSLLQTHASPYTLDAEPRIVSIAVVRGDGSVLGVQRINPGVSIPEAATRIHGIDNAAVAGCPTFSAVWPRILARIGPDALVAAHNAPYDRAVLAVELMRLGASLPRWSWGCTLAAARRLIPASPRHTLDALGAVLGLPTRLDHSSLSDARAAAELGAELTARDPTWLTESDPWSPLPDGDVVAVTGHRHITSADVATVDREVTELTAAGGVTRMVFGGATGVDTAALYAASARPWVHCTVIVPGTVAQQPPDARAAIEARADDVVELGAGNLRTAEAYHARDRMMCHRASRVLAFLDGRRESSGTRVTAEYARWQGRPVTVVGLQGRR